MKSIRNKLLSELNAQKIFVAWEDRNAEVVKMVIEGEGVVHRKYFDSLVADKLPHGIWKYNTYPSNGARGWAETHIYFHV